MEPNKISNDEAKELLEAVTHISNHNIAYLNSMTLKCAVELGIPEAIHKHGKPMSIDELANSLSIHPTKIPSLNQLMRLLVHNKFFATKTLTNNNDGDETLLFDLTLNSQLLLKDHPLTQAPLTLMGTELVVTKPSHNFATWFQNGDVEKSTSPFHLTYGRHLYEGVPSDDGTKFDELFQQAMTSDSQLISRVLLTSKEFKDVMQGVESLVDVGGGDGTMAKAIAEVYPEVKCIVFDLPQVVDGLQGNEKAGKLTYVAGDMFEAIPRAQVLLLKAILHNWNDDNCIKILKQCKEAMATRDNGGKLLIIDMVVGTPDYNQNQCLANVHMMSILGGKERTEQQWKYLIISAGYSNYKILPILGPRSVIEVYS